MKKNLVAFLIILLGAILLSIPLLKPGLHLIHDDQQIARLFLFDQALKSGQFPVRWVDGLGFGFGYPLFVFYPPLVYILGELFHILGFGFISSVELVFFTSILASGLAMYVFVKDLWGKVAAIISALFYMIVPYRALDIYVRGALAESFSVVWLPFILWSFYKLSTTQKSIYIYLSAIFLALLMITHNLIFLPFMILLPFYLLFLVWKSDNKKKFLVNCQLSIVTCFALSAFFWLPALLEKKFTIVDELLLVNLASYNIHFVSPQQLWNWPWGFGGSAEGLADGISFKIGKLHILVSLLTMIFALIHLRFKKLSTVNCQLSTVFFALFIFCAFMTTSYSQFIWDLIPPLAYLQFPWRFLTFTALFGSILAGALIFSLRVPILKLMVSIILVILLLVPNLKLFKPQAYRPSLTDASTTSEETINWYVSSSSFEYLPNGIDLYKSNLGTNVVDIKKSDIPKQKIEVAEGLAEIKNLKLTPHKITFSADAKNQTQVKANIFNFPGWQVAVDGNLTEINDNNRLKLITFSVPTGLHQVKIEFKNTQARNMANLISFMIIFAMILFALSKLRSPKKEILFNK